MINCPHWLHSKVSLASRLYWSSEHPKPGSIVTTHAQPAIWQWRNSTGKLPYGVGQLASQMPPVIGHHSARTSTSQWVLCKHSATISWQSVSVLLTVSKYPDSTGYHLIYIWPASDGAWPTCCLNLTNINYNSGNISQYSACSWPVLSQHSTNIQLELNQQ